jgi:hypothetical protein
MVQKISATITHPFSNISKNKQNAWDQKGKGLKNMMPA